VLRAAVIWIVVAFAGAPNVSLLCRVWCDAQAPTVPGCHHRQTPTVLLRVTSADSCERMVLSVTPFVREDLRRGVVGPDTVRGVAVSHDCLADTASQAHRFSAPHSNGTLARQPNLTALRI
jgi:hypothetical protein